MIYLLLFLLLITPISLKISAGEICKDYVLQKKTVTPHSCPPFRDVRFCLIYHEDVITWETVDWGDFRLAEKFADTTYIQVIDTIIKIKYLPYEVLQVHIDSISKEGATWIADTLPMNIGGDFEWESTESTD